MEVVCKKKHEKNASKVKLSDRTTKEQLATLPEIVLEGEHPAEQPTSEFPVDDRLGYVSKDEGTASEKRCKGETDPRNNDTYAPQFENVSECAKQCTLKEPNHLLQTEKASGDSQVSYKAAEMENESVKVEKMAVSVDDAANHVEEPVPFEVEQHGQTLTSIKDGRLYPTLDSIPRGIQCTAPPCEEDGTDRQYNVTQPSAPNLSTDSSGPPSVIKMPNQREIILSQRKTLTRVYPELDLKKLSVLPMSEAEMLRLNQGVLLQQRERLEDTFIEMYSEERLQEHELFKLLSEYYAEKSALSACSHQLDELIVKAQELRDHVWSMGRGQVSAYDRCGDNSRVEKSHEYEIANYERHQAARFRDTLRQLGGLLRAEFASRNHSAQVLKIQIEQVLNKGLFPFQTIPKTAPIPRIDLSHNLSGKCSCTHEIFMYPGEHRWSREQESTKESLRVTISILFCFTRRPFEDAEYIKEVRQWLRSSIAVLLRVAALEDHFFILSHILRCPAGISKWAVDLIQMPPSDAWTQQEEWINNNFQPGQVFDYPMLALNLICSPVKQREVFLRKFKTVVDESPADTWCIVDGDGENGASGEPIFFQWAEQDIVDLLNQIPFREIFKYILLADEVYDIDRTTAKHMLKLISFSTHLVYTLRVGLRTYHSRRYRNLTKRISRLIRHCVEYISDHWEAFRAANPSATELTRIQVEYDQFLLRAVNSIFFSESLGAWQFMAVLPYQNVSHGIIWQLLWLLHNNYREEVQLVDMRVHEIAKQLQSPARLEEKIENMLEEEVFYLLTTFANMAISRQEANRAFIHTVAVEVFNITYIHEKLREVHSKVGRDLLSRLVTKHPFVVSVLLDQIHQNMSKVGNMACYLFSGFELTRWIPEDEDLDILYGFLVENDLVSSQNSLARLVLQNMNYGYDENTGNLFLPQHNHQKIALIILAAYKAHYLPFDKTGYAYKQFKYISDYALGTKQPATPDSFIQYLWDLLLQLHLHLLDYPHHAQRKLITDDEPPIGVALSLDSVSWLEPLRVGVSEGLPPALYIALMMCSMGHYREEIVTRGVSFIVDLVNKDQFRAAIESIHRITAVFICKSELLVTHVKFLQAMETIIQADNTYSAIVKNLVVSSFPGDILSQLGRIIILQVRKAKAWSLQTKCVLMWLQILFNLPEMSVKRGTKAKARESVYFLLDILVQLAYQEVGCIEKVFLFLQDSLSSVVSSNVAYESMVRSVMSYVWWGSGSSWPILVALSSVKQFPWFAWAGLVAEGRVELNCRPWKQLIKEMAANTKLTTEAALKLVSSSMKNVPSQEFILVYRWAQQALETEMNHPALPLIWQQFFQLYLQRAPTGCCVGLRLFEGTTYHPVLKQLKRRLNELTGHYHRRYCDLAKNLQEQPLSDHTKKTGRALAQMNELCQLFGKLQKYFRSLYLWLEEPRIHDPNVTLLALPPQYNSELLQILLCNRAGLWTDLVHQELIEECLDKLSEKKNAFKVKQQLQSTQIEQTVEQKILHRLRCYDDTQGAPPLPIIKLAIPEVTEQVLLRGEKLLQNARSELKTIMGHARAFNAQSIHLSNLDENIDDYLKKLYTNEDRSIEFYMACALGPKCKQHARLVFRFHEATKNKVVSNNVVENRNEWTTIICDLRSPPSTGVINACAFVESVITKLVNFLQLQPITGLHLRKTGGKLFAELVSFMNKDCLEHTPTRQFLTQCLEVLGQAVVRPDPTQTRPLLDLILRNPHLVSYLSPYFAPAVCEPSRYAEMYNVLCYNLGPALYETQFILLSKFDVGSYLRTTPTTALDRQNLIGTLKAALQSIGRKSKLEPLLSKIEALYLNQMQTLLAVNDFEHYFQIFNMLLNGVRLNNIPLETFTTFFKALGYESITQGDLPVICGAPGASRVEESIKMMSDFFKDFRNKEASAPRKGLYCLCDYYLSSLAPLYTLMGTLYIVQKGQSMSQNMPSASDIDHTLQAIFDLYEPWLGVVQEGKKYCLPWLPGEKQKIAVMLQSYVQLLGVVQTVLSRIQSSVFHSLWQRYFISYVWNATPNYITTFYYEKILSLPWEAFVPNVQDLRLMTKVLEPEYVNHLPFLIQILLRLDWTYLLSDLAIKWDHTARTEAYSRFVELLLKTGWDKTVTASGRTRDLCHSLAELDWSCVPGKLLKDLMLFFETKCDPLCVLLPDDNSQDDVLLSFMQNIACLRTVNASCSTLEKQAAYFAMTARLVRRCAETPGTRNLVKNRQCVSQFMPKHMTYVTSLINSKQPDFNDQSLTLIKDVFSVLDIVDSFEWTNVLTDGLVLWISANPGSDLILSCISVAASLSNQQAVPHIVEACIAAYSKSELEIFSSDGGWSTMLTALRFPGPKIDELLKAAVESSSFLTLYAYVLHKLRYCGSLENELTLLGRIVDWVVESIPVNEEAEPKILLLWDKLLVLSIRQLEYGGDVRIVFRHLQRFVGSLLQAGEDKVSSGLLGAIGFGRRSPLSIKFRFNSRLIAAIVAQHLTEDGLVMLQARQNAAGEHKPHRFASEALAKVRAMQGNKVYSDLHNELEAALSLVNSCSSLIDSQEAVKQLVNFFYPTLAYLKILFFGVME
ncbi:ectopic P granules protein 5 homolog isoform X2 [Varroa jacobsoni]|uniref:ectopic P granules protein 5 homolog isoform X2 n=1 Tax=Varroa jacobsoni TaxID=62625 RepID=UPI000BF83EE3|nr:ectopic P granules protein 5 homolog isoform X2 [Varroa jacobsoni]